VLFEPLQFLVCLSTTCKTPEAHFLLLLATQMCLVLMLHITEHKICIQFSHTKFTSNMLHLLIKYNVSEGKYFIALL